MFMLFVVLTLGLLRFKFSVPHPVLLGNFFELGSVLPKTLQRNRKEAERALQSTRVKQCYS